MMQLPTRTETGYQLGNLIAENLPLRQSQLLILTIQGWSEKECASLMNCSLSNVQKLKQTLFYKLNANKSAELAIKAITSAYLRVVPCFLAVVLGFCTSLLGDHNLFSRTGTSRLVKQSSTRTTVRIRLGDGLYWSPETNELVWS